jgi:nicotinamide riboside kinase
VKSPPTIELPAPPTDNIVRIYAKAYRTYRKLLSGNLIDKERRRDIMVMLIAPEVDFDRDRTRKCSRQRSALVDKVFDNMEKNGLWKDGRWAFTHGWKDDDKEDRKCFIIEFVLHVMCARGEAVYISEQEVEPCPLMQPSTLL